MHERSEPQEPRPGIKADKEARATAIKVALALLIVIVFVLFIVRNSKPVRVDFVFFSKQIRLVWVFLACAIIGAVVAWLLGRPRRRAQKRLIEELERYRKESD
jgi:uncharacterized integral membrane protein